MKQIKNIFENSDERLLTLLNQYVNELQLESSDQRVAFTISRDFSQVSINLNFGYIFTANKYKSGRFDVHIVLPETFVEKYKKEFIETSPWSKKIKGEIYRNKWCKIDHGSDLLYSNELFKAWIECSRAYLRYGTASSYRRHHEETVFHFLRGQ